MARPSVTTRSRLTMPHQLNPSRSDCGMISQADLPLLEALTLGEFRCAKHICVEGLADMCKTAPVSYYSQSLAPKTACIKPRASILQSSPRVLD